MPLTALAPKGQALTRQADRFIDAADVNRTRRGLDVGCREKIVCADASRLARGSIGRLFEHTAKRSVL